jgi:hypothetical protein
MCDVLGLWITDALNFNLLAGQVQRAEEMVENGVSEQLKDASQNHSPAQMSADQVSSYFLYSYETSKPAPHLRMLY